MTRRLERSARDKVWTGVCGGLAEYLQVDATLVRAFFVIATLLTAFAFALVYIALLVLMPLPGGTAPIDDVMRRSASADAVPPAQPGFPGEPEPASPRPVEDDRSRAVIGYLLLGIGLIFLLGNLGVFRPIRWDLVWPVAIIGLGALLLLQRSRR